MSTIPTTRPEGDDHWIVTVLINIDTDWSHGWTPDNRLAYDYAMVLDVQAPDADAAAEQAYVIGNRQATDAEGKAWPAWVRSVSVGDVMQVRGWGPDEAVDLTVMPLGFNAVTLGDDSQWNRPGGRRAMATAGHASSLEVK